MTIPSVLADPAVLRSEIRRQSRRASLIGLAVAAGVGLLLAAGFFALQRLAPEGAGEGLGAGDVVPVAAYVVVLLAIGAAAGLQVVNLRLAQQMQQAFGSGQAARRVRRVVLGGEQPANEEEADQAARYAPAAAAVIPLQMIAGTVLLAAIGLNLLVQFLTLDVGSNLHALQLVLLLILVATAAVLVPIQVRNARRAQHYQPATGHDKAATRG